MNCNTNANFSIPNNRAYVHLGFGYLTSITNPRYVVLDDMSNTTDNLGVSRQPLDWSSSSFGLFMGLLSLVALIINLIVYFALVDQVHT